MYQCFNIIVQKLATSITFVALARCIRRHMWFCKGQCVMMYEFQLHAVCVCIRATTIRPVTFASQITFTLRWVTLKILLACENIVYF